MKHNLLVESLITASGWSRQEKALTLPGLFAAMARQEVAGFVSLRPHQRAAWHVFLVQLAALALWNADQDRLPEDGETWAAFLRGLTTDFDHDEPWCLIVENPERPAFLQPPDPGGLKWKPVPTPDNLDMLSTSKNFDEKHAVAYASEAEDWLYALVSLQTMAGYSGQGNYGIVRMSSGLSSRPLLGLAPGSALDTTVCPSAWWARDVRRLLHGSRTSGVGAVGGPALLWCLPWPEGEQLQVPNLDPWFIETSRRVRLEDARVRITARRSTSGRPRTDGGPFKGNVGDPWIPVENKEGKSLTLGRRGFTYVRLNELLFSGNWKRPILAEYGPHESEDMVLVAEAFGRGKRKTEGFHARHVPVPGRAFYESATAAECAKQQMEEIKAFDNLLRNALAAVAAGGDWRRSESKHYEYAQTACSRFDRRADRLFFEALWKRVAAHQEGGNRSFDGVRKAFLEDLRHAARIEFETGLSSMPCPSALRHRAEARAHRQFRKGLRKQFPELSVLSVSEELNGRRTDDAACAAAAWLQRMSADELAQLRRMPVATGGPAFESLAARHPDTIGRRDREEEWNAIVRTLAILTPKGNPAERPPLHDPQRRLGTVFCDGGDSDWLEREQHSARPFLSETRLLQLLVARGQVRAGHLHRAARRLSACMPRGSGVDVTDIVAILLTPQDGRRIAQPYYRCLDRALSQSAAEHRRGIVL